MPEERSHMPDANRLSVLVAAVLLAYALAHLIETQRYVFNFKVLGIAFPLPLNMNVAATFMATGLTAAGMDWLLRGHPHYEGKNTFQHWILPALTSFALGLPLYNLPFGPAWWLSFGLGGGLCFCWSSWLNTLRLIQRIFATRQLRRDLWRFLMRYS